MPIKVFIGAAARAEASIRGYEHWAMITRWHEYADGLIVVKRDMTGTSMCPLEWSQWEIVQQPTKLTGMFSE